MLGHSMTELVDYFFPIFWNCHIRNLYHILQLSTNFWSFINQLFFVEQPSVFFDCTFISFLQIVGYSLDLLTGL